MAYQAPNRMNNLRTYFAPTGPVIIPRVWTEAGETPPWQLALSLAGMEQARPQPQNQLASFQINKNRLEYQHEGILEWYRNSENGLEQGFLIEQGSLPGSPSGLLLELVISTDLKSRVVSDGAAIEFLAEDSLVEQGLPVLRYGSLQVEDNFGQSIPYQVDLTPSKITLIIPSAAFSYPIQVNALISGLPSTWNWKVEGGVMNTEFGNAVSTAGDVNGDGYSDVVVGAPGYDGGQALEGRAYVFHGSATGLSTTASWVKESDQAGARFGAAVSTAGDVNGDGIADVIIGAPYWESTASQADEGGIWVYHGNYMAGLNTIPNGHAESNQSGALLGISVSTAGNVNGDAYSDVIAGASNYDNGQVDEGVVWVWHGSASGIGTGTTPNWVGESNQVSAHFGNSVSLAGDVNSDSYTDIIIGAPEYNNGQTDEGMVFVWHGSINGLNNNVNGNPTNAAWKTESDQESALLGVDVNTAGDVNGDGFSDIIVGAPFYTSGQASEGGTWVYHGSASGLATSAATHDEGNQVNARFGTAVSTAGDVNGDGYGDIIIGAPGYTNGEVEEGRAWVWYGSSTGVSATHDWRAEGNLTDANFGISVATAGDVNGDGFSDIIIGASGYTNPNTSEGAAFCLSRLTCNLER